jgi:hypothetical protein
MFASSMPRMSTSQSDQGKSGLLISAETTPCPPIQHNSAQVSILAVARARHGNRLPSANPHRQPGRNGSPPHRGVAGFPGLTAGTPIFAMIPLSRSMFFGPMAGTDGRPADGDRAYPALSAGTLRGMVQGKASGRNDEPRAFQRQPSFAAGACGGVATPPPHPEEQPQAASRRVGNGRGDCSPCFETVAARPPQHEGFIRKSGPQRCGCRSCARSSP